MARRKADPLLVQAAVNIRAPRGKKFSDSLLRRLLKKWVEGEELPSSVEIRSIFWRNPARRGELGRWRYHEGADLRNAPRPLESSPRGSLEDARNSLLDGRLPLENITFR